MLVTLRPVPTVDSPHTLPEDAALQNRHTIRWYVMVYPSSGRAMTEELDRELRRRQRDGEPLFEYFAPAFVETRKINGSLVETRRPLL